MIGIGLHSCDCASLSGSSGNCVDATSNGETHAAGFEPASQEFAVGIPTKVRLMSKVVI